MPCKETSQRRESLLANLKNLVDQIDGGPCCPPRGCPLPPSCCPGTCPPLSAPVPLCPPPCAPCCVPPVLPICTPVPPPCVPMCNPPPIMVCYRRPQERGSAGGRSKSRELRASVLYRGCDCEKRNGLQDDCPRSECHGSPECLTKPKPTCGPSAYADGKHLGQNNASQSDGIEQYQCYPAYVKLPQCCPPACCPPTCCSPPCCPPPCVPLIAQPPCPPPIIPTPPPCVPIGRVVPVAQAVPCPFACPPPLACCPCEGGVQCCPPCCPPTCCACAC